MTDNSPAQSAINQLVMGDLSAPAYLVAGHVDASALLRQAAIDASLDLPECCGFEDLSFGGSGESLSGKVAFLSVDNDHLVRSIGQAFDLGEDGPNATVKALLNLRGAQAAVIVVDARRAPNNLALITALDMAQSRSCGALRFACRPTPPSILWREKTTPCWCPV